MKSLHSISIGSFWRAMTNCRLQPRGSGVPGGYGYCLEAVAPAKPALGLNGYALEP